MFMIEDQLPRRPFWRWLALSGIGLASVAGCGKPTPYGLAAVSGVVTLDGQPVPYTQITFMPQASPANPNPGPGSTATCDDAGHFELKTVRGESGAVVGPHAVSISATGPPRLTDSDSPTGPAPKDAFPSRYNTGTELTFEVPADGTTAADFKLTTAP
jgi:hypothetical protein